MVASDALETALCGRQEQLLDAARTALSRIDFGVIDKAAEAAARDPGSSGGTAVLPFEISLYRTSFVAALIVFHCIGGAGCVSCGGCQLNLGLAPLTNSACVAPQHQLVERPDTAAGGATAAGGTV